MCDEVRHWETNVARHLDDFNIFASTWRLDIPQRSSSLGAYSNTRTAETTRATETLCTSIFRMMTAQDPNFGLYAMRDDVTEDHLARHEAVLRTQHRRIFYKRKLLKAVRSMVLFGTTPVEIPWWMDQANGKTYFEGTDFVPLSLLQFAFDPSCPEIKQSDYKTPMWFISAARLRAMAKGAPGVWDQKAVEDAIEECKDASKVNKRIADRLQKAGYQITEAKTLIMTTRWGVDPETGASMRATCINEKYLVAYHPNPFEHGRDPFLISSMIDFELEPYGYGVGNLGKRMQAEMDSNRNRNNDLMTFSQWHMWKAARSSGLKMTDLRMVPFKIIQLDETGSLEPLRPDLTALKPGLEHEERIKGDFRAVTGATDNLQAEQTQATATEASITQNEAVRRIAVIAELAAEELVREYVELSIKNNAQLLDEPIWANITGEGSPMMILPGQLRKEIGVECKITTDKDFRPERTRRLIEALQILTNIRQQIPGNVDITPLIQEIMRDFGINPKKVIKPYSAFDRMMDAIKQSQMLAGKVPNGGVQPGGVPPGGSPPNADQGNASMTAGGAGGAGAAIPTPVGDVATTR